MTCGPCRSDRAFTDEVKEPWALVQTAHSKLGARGGKICHAELGLGNLLYVSEPAVRFYQANARAKLEVAITREAVVNAYMLGLIRS
jgi:hypothetical protein